MKNWKSTHPQTFPPAHRKNYHNKILPLTLIVLKSSVYHQNMAIWSRPNQILTRPPISNRKLILKITSSSGRVYLPFQIANRFFFYSPQVCGRHWLSRADGFEEILWRNGCCPWNGTIFSPLPPQVNETEMNDKVQFSLFSVTLQQMAWRSGTLIYFFFRVFNIPLSWKQAKQPRKIENI